MPVIDGWTVKGAEPFLDLNSHSLKPFQYTLNFSQELQCHISAISPFSNFSSWLNMIPLSNVYLQLSELGALISSLDNAWRYFHDLVFWDFRLSFLWLSWPCSSNNFSSSDSALVLELRAPRWSGSWESMEAAQLPHPNTQDIPNQFDYSFAWKMLDSLEPKWLWCFTEGLFQILREGEKN